MLPTEREGEMGLRRKVDACRARDRDWAALRRLGSDADRTAVVFITDAPIVLAINLLQNQ
jgi:hypothetical protein